MRTLGTRLRAGLQRNISGGNGAGGVRRVFMTMSFFKIIALPEPSYEVTAVEVRCLRFPVSLERLAALIRGF